MEVVVAIVENAVKKQRIEILILSLLEIKITKLKSWNQLETEKTEIEEIAIQL